MMSNDQIISDLRFYHSLSSISQINIVPSLLYLRFLSSSQFYISDLYHSLSPISQIFIVLSVLYIISISFSQFYISYQYHSLSSLSQICQIFIILSVLCLRFLSSTHFYIWDLYHSLSSAASILCLNRIRPSRSIRCDVWIVERMRYRPTDRPTETDTASYRGALSHLKMDRRF